MATGAFSAGSCLCAKKVPSSALALSGQVVEILSRLLLADYVCIDEKSIATGYARMIWTTNFVKAVFRQHTKLAINNVNYLLECSDFDVYNVSQTSVKNSAWNILILSEVYQTHSLVSSESYCQELGVW